VKRWSCIVGIFALILLTLILGLAGGVVLDRGVLLARAPQYGIPAEAVPSFRLMAEAWNTVDQVYVDREAVQPKQLTYGAISGMVDALGDTGHSRFLSPEMLQVQHNVMEGEFEGIGAEVQMKDGHVIIVAPLDDSPAQKAGLLPGDIILKVDGESTANLSLIQVVDRIQGPAGTSVRLTLMDSSGRVWEVAIVRARIVIQNVTWRRLPDTGVAHVRIATFSQGVTEDLKKALTEIQQQELTALILDLRNNPGGLLAEAVGTTSQFLDDGNVLLERDIQGRVTPVPVESGGVAIDSPMVVLINSGSASASEIVAGALQDAHRATVVGETTFGTGTVLSEFELSDGSALLLAVQEWLTPNGRAIWHQGIAPDVVVSSVPGVIPLRPETERDMTPAQLQASGDEQLLRALELLDHPINSSSP
jgi:carboxyl-terminal processing protease